jgi:hypothetical protein
MHVEFEQLEFFSLVSIEGGSFDVEVDFFNIPTVVPTKFRSKYMMKRKGKEQVEGGSSLTKVTQKQALVEAKEIQKMLKWIQMGSKKRQWAE